MFLDIPERGICDVTKVTRADLCPRVMGRRRILLIFACGSQRCGWPKASPRHLRPRFAQHFPNIFVQSYAVSGSMIAITARILCVM